MKVFDHLWAFWDWLCPSPPTPRRAKVLTPKSTPIVWDRVKVKTDIARLSQEIKLLKKGIRQPGIHISATQHSNLSSLKEQVTVLCTVLAASRGKIHTRYLSVVCHQCHPCPQGVRVCQIGQQHRIKCPHSGPVSESAWDDWFCNGCGDTFTIRRPQTLETQLHWLNNRLLYHRLKATYGK